jgi:hypothetical protein
MEEQCLMRGPSVSDLGFLHCLLEGTKFNPNFGLCADFSVYRFAPSLLPVSGFGSVNNIRPSFDFDLPLQTVIWIIALSMGVTESFPSVPLHLRNGFCALVYVGRDKEWHLKQACSTYHVVRATSANFGLRAGNKVQYI